jgi:hypothetical protein
MNAFATIHKIIVTVIVINISITFSIIVVTTIVIAVTNIYVAIIDDFGVILILIRILWTVNNLTIVGLHSLVCEIVPEIVPGQVYHVPYAHVGLQIWLVGAELQADALVLADKVRTYVRLTLNALQVGVHGFQLAHGHLLSDHILFLLQVLAYHLDLLDALLLVQLLHVLVYQL